MSISRIIVCIVSMPKTIYFNFRCLPFRQALKLPVFIKYDVMFGELHSNIIRFNTSLSPFKVRFGLGGVKGIDAGKTQIWLQNGTITFNGTANFAKGFSLRNNGNIIFGNGFIGGKNCFLSCADEIVFGDDVHFAWNGTIRDSDGHSVYVDGIEKPSHKPVHIGSHVWITSEVKILKGVTIPNNCVVALGSIVTKPFYEENILIGGYPAKKIQGNISWIY